MTPSYKALGFREWPQPVPMSVGHIQSELELNAIAHQKLAVRLLEWACGAGGRGHESLADLPVTAVTEYHPRYKLVTENRDWRNGKPDKDYSSCGDLAHWLHYRMGVRDPRVNRAEYTHPAVVHHPQHPDAPNYKVGANVSRLTQWLPKAAPNVGTTLDAAPGDVLIVRGAPGTEHVICVIDHTDGGAPGSRILWTAEYGQPGGALRTRDVRLQAPTNPPSWMPGLYIGTHRILYHIRLLDVLAQARAAGRLVSAEEPPA